MRQAEAEAERDVRGTEVSIPLLLTQTWRSTNLPQAAEQLSRTWKKHNPALTHRIFDDQAAAGLVAEVVPDFLDDYLRLPHPVMRADFFRYAAIYRDGGLYADIDMECVRPLDRLLQSAPAVFSIEAQLTDRRRRELGYANPFQIANCIFAAEAGHPLLLALMKQAIALARSRSAIAREEIEDVTGPRMLTRLFFAEPRTDVAVLHQIYLMAPRHYPRLWPFSVNVHARHHFFGSWKSSRQARSLGRIWIERDRWPNPFPGDRTLNFDEPRHGLGGIA